MGAMTNNKQKKQGFTIIEVVLVLAIAGLIFAIVFSALPAVQRSRRDTERKQDLATIVAEIDVYGANNRGNYPVGFSGIRNLIATVNRDGNFVDPLRSVAYETHAKWGKDGGVNLNPEPGSIVYSSAARCDESTPSGLKDSGGFTRTYAIVMRLEQGTFCQESS